MTDDKTTINLTRRKALGGLAVLGAAGASAGAGTYALFSDKETAMNQITMGDLNLQLGDGSDGTASGTWSVSNTQPGQFALGSVTLENAGSEQADHVELDISTSPTEAGHDDDADTQPNSAEGFSNILTVYRLKYSSPNAAANDLYARSTHPTDQNGNGLIDLADLMAAQDTVLDDLEPPTPENGNTTTFTLGLYIFDTDQAINDYRLGNATPTDAVDVTPDPSKVKHSNNDFQGDKLDITVTASLHQRASQDY
ncbi:MAG: TasA family protein [Halorientalis sp.]